MLRYWRTIATWLVALALLAICYKATSYNAKATLAEVSAACTTGGYIIAANGDLYRCVYHGKR